MIAVALEFLGKPLGKAAMVAALILALVAGAWGFVHESNARAVAESRADAAQATYHHQIEVLQTEAKAVKARAAALGAVHQRIADAPPTTCPTAPAVMRDFLLRSPGPARP